MGQCTLVLPGTLFSPSPKKYKRISPEKIFLIFWEIRFKNLYFLNAPYTPSPDLVQRMLHPPAFIKASPGASSSSLKVAEPLTEVQNTDLAHLFV